MSTTPRYVLDFQERVQLTVERALELAGLNLRQKSVFASRFLKVILDDLLQGIITGEIDPADVEVFFKRRIAEIANNGQLEQQILQALGNDLSRVANEYEQAFRILDPGFSIQDVQVLARKQIGAYALDNGVKIGERMAINVANMAKLYSGDELYNMANSQLGAATSRLRTVVQDISLGYSRDLVFKSAEKSGLTHYAYYEIINTNTRFFCRQLVKLPYCYTLEQINQMSNGHDLSVETYCGGYNCIHHWLPGQVGWPGFEKPFPEAGRMVSKIGPDESQPVTIPQA